MDCAIRQAGRQTDRQADQRGDDVDSTCRTEYLHCVEGSHDAPSKIFRASVG
jgi:hypothetical protein